jgi:serine/threonine protein kinase
MLHFPSHTEPRTVSDEFIKNYLADVRNHISKGEDFYVPEVTIVDFGLSREYEDHQKGLCKTGCGTAYYVAPEIYEELNYDNRVDIWAIGTIIYKLLFGKYPFKGNELEIVKANTLKGDYSIRKNAEVSIEMLEIIHKCLKANPDERPMNIDLTIAFENFSLVKLLNE